MTRQGRTARPTRTAVGPARGNGTFASPSGTEPMYFPAGPGRNTPEQVRGASVAVADHLLQAGCYPDPLTHADRHELRLDALPLLAMLGLPTVTEPAVHAPPEAEEIRQWHQDRGLRAPRRDMTIDPTAHQEDPA